MRQQSADIASRMGVDAHEDVGDVVDGVARVLLARSNQGVEHRQIVLRLVPAHVVAYRYAPSRSGETAKKRAFTRSTRRPRNTKRQRARPPSRK